jgi:hypothetical protein
MGTGVFASGDVRHLPFWLWIVRLWGVEAGTTRASLLLRRDDYCNDLIQSLGKGLKGVPIGGFVRL